MTKQLPIPFAEDDNRRLPLIVAAKSDFSLQYYLTNDKIYYAVQDWIVGLTGATSVKASEMWRRMKDQTRISITSLPYVASDGKTYQRDFTDDQGLYLIAQRLRVTRE